jgi:hypothetical protein
MGLFSCNTYQNEQNKQEAVLAPPVPIDNRRKQEYYADGRRSP